MEPAVAAGAGAGAAVDIAGAAVDIAAVGIAADAEVDRPFLHCRLDQPC